MEDEALSLDHEHATYEAGPEVVAVPPSGPSSIQTLGTVPEPEPIVLASLSPATIASGQPPVTVTVSGSGFTPVSQVWADEAGQPTTFVSDTELSYGAEATAPGSQTITVRDGMTSNAIELAVT